MFALTHSHSKHSGSHLNTLCIDTKLLASIHKLFVSTHRIFASTHTHAYSLESMLYAICIDTNSLRSMHLCLVSTHTIYVSTHKFVFQLTFSVSIYKTVWQFLQH